MNGTIDSLFDLIRDLFKPERISLVVGAILGGVSWHYSVKFLNESSEATYAMDSTTNIALGLAMVLVSSLMIKLVLSPNFGAALGDTYKESQKASGIGGLLRVVSIVGQLVGIFGATLVAWGFDWYTTSNGLGTTAFPLLDVRQAPAILCVFGPSGMVALSSLQRKMMALSPSPRSNYGGGARLP